jgi:hypothetical protein
MKNESRAGKLIRSIDRIRGQLTESKDVAKSHQKKIALKTLTYSDAGADVMGGMTKKEAIDFLRKNGYNDKKLVQLLKNNKYSEEEIKKLLEGK